MRFGEIEVIDQEGMTAMPQEAASAWTAMEGYVGADYKPLNYVGGKPVKGIDHVFIAQQTLVLARPERHIVLVTINEFDGNYNVVSIERVI